MARGGRTGKTGRTGRTRKGGVIFSNAFNKEILRSITHSWGRFIAIAIIVALGTGFYAGLRMTAPDMKLAADIYYDGTNLYDIRVLTTYGLDEEDIEKLEAIEGVEAVMPAYETDAMSIIDGEQYVVRIHSLDVDAAQASDSSDGVTVVSDDEGYLNRLILTEGSWPQNEGECVISADVIMKTEVSIGDTVELTEGTSDLEDTLKTTTYTIVGFVQSSYYTSSASMGTTSLGSGSIQQFLYVPESDFMDSLPYTEAFISVSGAQDLLATSDEYEDLVAETMERIEAIVPDLASWRLEAIRAEAQEELDEQYREFEDARDEAYAELDDAQAELDDALATLESSKEELDAALAQLESSEQELARAQRSYDEGVQELADQRASAQQQFAAAQAQIDEQRSALDEGYEQISQLETQLAAVRAQIEQTDPSDPSYETLLGTEAVLTSALSEAQATVSAGETALAAAQAELDAQQSAAEAQFAAAQATLDEAAAQIAEGTAQLIEGRAEYESGLEVYEEGLASYEEGLAEFEEQRDEALAELADAEEQLADAQEEIDELESPSVYVMDRSKNVGAVSFVSDADRIDQIAKVFPLFFFLVAALVALTTMTRMVEEERILIGTYKALGYSRSRITSKYLFYAALASCVGSFVGIVSLGQLLPAIIHNAYGVVYVVPAGPTPLDPALTAISAIAGVGITLLATAAASTSTLREYPASLMLPRAPKMGKRILLERVKPLWRHLSFSWKVTFRNIFRYKKRLFMTLVGIAGCTALLLTGLGLSNAVNDIIDKQFGEIYRYNMTIGLDDEDLSEEDEETLSEVLDDSSFTERSTRLFSSTMTARSTQVDNAFVADDEEAASDDQLVQVIVPEDPDDFENYVLLRERVGHADLSLTDEGAIICEKLATELDLEVGDTLVLFGQNEIGDAEGEGYEVLIAGIMENYTDQLVLLTSDLYEQIFGEEPEFTTIFAQVTEDETDRLEASASLLEADGISTVAYIDETIQAYRDTLTSVDSVVVVLVIAAAALAFVVMYNLTNINITERLREIATLKVLGFTSREVDAYIFRETLLLTVIGCLLGLALGVVMENYVVVTAEVDQVMFGREIHLLSFVGSFVLTFLFSVLVMLTMRGKLARIDMVESMKSVD